MTERCGTLLTQLGFRFGINGPHAARTMMLDDLRVLMAHMHPQACDIFVRWKSLAEQPIGWASDFNDGVRLNIYPFMTAEVLRHNKPVKLNIKWEKVWGKDVASAPWFGVFGGDRINDHHVTRAEKLAAQAKP